MRNDRNGYDDFLALPYPNGCLGSIAVLEGVTEMTGSAETRYMETVSCEPRRDEGVVFIKVVAMPHEAAVEFDVTQARAFAQQILAAVEDVEAGWVGKTTRPSGQG